MYILGINAYHPDASAAIVVDGKLSAYAEEEEFTGIKHFAGFPRESIRFCLEKTKICVKDIDYIAIPRDPRMRIFKKVLYGIKIPALIKHRLSVWRNTFSIKKDLSQLFNLGQEKIRADIVKAEHHRSHLASAFFSSGFDKASLLSMDALGDFASTVWGIGEKKEIKILGEVVFPHSLGFYYTAITQYLGFLDFGDEYKLMALASEGEPEYVAEFKKILKAKGNGFQLDLKYFLHHKRYIDMTFAEGAPKVGFIFSPYLEKRLGACRKPQEAIEKRHKNIAFAVQKRLEEIVLGLAGNVASSHMSNLCLSGGVANNRGIKDILAEKTRFKNIYIPPKPGDAGLSVGAALYFWNKL